LNTNGLYAPRLQQQMAGLAIDFFLVSLDGLPAANDRIRGQAYSIGWCALSAGYVSWAAGS